MALSGIEWNMASVFDTELRSLRSRTSKEDRSPEEQVIVEYLKQRIQELDVKKKEPVT